jgi:hypothetical protein
MDTDELTRRFAYHKPPDDRTMVAHDTVRLSCVELAHNLNVLLPEGREKSLAITHLEEVMFWSNASIARDPLPRSG